MYEVRQTVVFAKWLDGLSDSRAATRIAQRIVRLQSGLFGDVRALGGGLSELRIDYGPGYRVYFIPARQDIDHPAQRWRQANAVARYRASQGLSGRSGALIVATRTIPFDAARYLDSVDSQVELLSDALESGDAGYIANALGIIARARGMAKVAREAGVTREALYRALSRDGDPKLTTLLGVVKSLGFQLSAQPAPSKRPRTTARTSRRPHAA